MSLHSCLLCYYTVHFACHKALPAATVRRSFMGRVARAHSIPGKAEVSEARDGRGLNVRFKDRSRQSTAVSYATNRCKRNTSNQRFPTFPVFPCFLFFRLFTWKIREASYKSAEKPLTVGFVESTSESTSNQLAVN